MEPPGPVGEPPRTAESPGQTLTSRPASTIGNWFTKTVIESLRVHCKLSTFVRKYSLVTEGHANGSTEFGSLSVGSMSQVILPVPKPPSCMVSPVQIVVSSPAYTCGFETITITVSKLAQPPLVTCTM